MDAIKGREKEEADMEGNKFAYVYLSVLADKVLAELVPAYPFSLF